MYKEKYLKYLQKGSALCYPYHMYPRTSFVKIPECNENEILKSIANSISSRMGIERENLTQDKMNYYSEFYTENKIKNLENLNQYLESIHLELLKEKDPSVFYVAIGNPVIESYNFQLEKNTKNLEIYMEYQFNQLFPLHVIDAINQNIKTNIIHIAPMKNHYSSDFTYEKMFSMKIQDKLNIYSKINITSINKKETAHGLLFIINNIHNLYIVDTLMPSYFHEINGNKLYFTDEDENFINIFYQTLKNICIAVNDKFGLSSIFSFAMFARLNNNFYLFPEIREFNNISLLGEWEQHNFLESPNSTTMNIDINSPYLISRFLKRTFIPESLKNYIYTLQYLKRFSQSREIMKIKFTPNYVSLYNHDDVRSEILNSSYLRLIKYEDKLHYYIGGISLLIAQ
jgi:hypothetical protein